MESLAPETPSVRRAVLSRAPTSCVDRFGFRRESTVVSTVVARVLAPDDEGSGVRRR